MAKTTARKEIPTRYGLLFSEEHSNGFSHFRFRVVTIGPTADDRRWFDQCPSSKLVDSTAIRNPNDRDPWHDLRINSQGDSATRGKLYAWDVQFFDVFRVDLDRAKRMHQALSKIQKRLDALSEKFGYAQTFTVFVGRVADAIGADTILYQRGKSSGWSYDDAEYQYCQMQTGLSILDHKIAEWTAPKEQAS
jgi:hypothetical protein